MELYDVIPFVRYCGLHTYSNDTMYRDSAYLMAYDSRMLYCMCGNGKIEVDGCLYEMSKGCLLIFKPCIEYRYLHSEQKSMVIISSNFDFTFDFSKTASQIIPPDPVDEFKHSKAINSPAPFDIIYINDANELERHVLELTETMENDNKFKVHELSSIMKRIIVKAVELKEGIPDNTVSSSGKLIEAVCKYISNNAESINSGKQIADEFSYHAYYINRLMVRTKGCTLHEYIRQAKVNKAIEYLASTEMSIAQIAEKCGFCDSSHFSNIFKSVTGYRPTKYRYL